MAKRPSAKPTNPLFDRKEQAQQKKQALLQEAVRVFNQRGYANASLEDVARNLNITKAALYYYFRSKQEILYECYCMSFDVWDEALEHAIAHGRNGRERVEIYVRRYIALGLGVLLPTINVREQEALAPEFRQKLARRRRTRRNLLRQIIADGIKDGSIRDCDPRIAVSVIAGAISWLFRVYRPDGDLSVEDFANQAVHLLLNGLATAKSRVPAAEVA
ncbi:MAG TPA: TetR/AcrR family transcriptional regulator [Burkholderiales bacterium]|jgi:AcrR family transcriptional regulator|nr:TetR/AcrR family transcriptional regulator [Burkholderiales bacterium]